MTERVDVAVVGAGFGGLALATLCADAGLSVAVLERRPELAPEGVGLVLQPNGLAALDRLGVLDRILEAGHRVDRARQCDPSGRVRAEAAYGELRHPNPYLVVVDRTSAIAVIAGRLPERATLRLGCAATGLDRSSERVTGVRYTGASGEECTLHATCVVGADGRNSVVREQLGVRVGLRTGPDRFLIGFAAVRAPHPDAAVLYCGRGWCDGVLPFGEQTYFFDHLVGASRDAVDRDDLDAWRESYAARIPAGDRIAACVRSFEDVGFLSGRTHRAAPRSAPGVALLGDAAAAVHPHNGQGANLALEDALALGTVLTEHGPGADLRAYARARDAKSRRYVPWSIFIGRTFDGPHAGWRAMRRFGYLASRIGPIRRSTTARQAGLG
ncbi:MAG TPA: NAD(P)/FAD-dependent oxidoreductase [Solirubrobacteraceae bacterium]|nr:NAD(P)/FAD-dependent oxidoreductase [Solirubrobacteraceae bacterium]